jgi:hypothetical protein
MMHLILFVLLMAAGLVPMKAGSAAEVREPKKEEVVSAAPVSWRTLGTAAALLLSPLFAGWALGRRGGEK